MKLAAVVVALAMTLALVPAASATLTFYYCEEFSGATPPAGPGPWLSASFTNTGVNTVQLVMSAGGLVGTEFVDDWLFNLDPLLSAGDLSFAFVSGGSTANAVNLGTNAFQADGDGLYDIQLDFPPPPGTFTAKFTAGELVTYNITYTGAGSFDENSFDFLSAPAGGHGPFKSAAHVQGIGTDGGQSGWVNDCVPTPEPSSMLLLGMGLTAASGMLVRRRKG